MKRFKLFFLTALSAAGGGIMAQSPLPGFQMGNIVAPDGNEWQSPERLALNKEQPRAYISRLTE
jgi:hypothetical protein